MSRTHFTDNLGRHYQVVGDHFAGEARVVIRHMPSAAEGCADSARTITPEDAPAVALAILEAAGTYDSTDSLALRDAYSALRQYSQEAEAKRAEREAEEAAALEWLQATDPWIGRNHKVTQNQVLAWKRNRDYFSKIHDEIVDAEIAEPRVLQHGDPEPDESTRWEDTEGSTWWFTGTGWTCSPVSNGARWPGGRECTERWFPMTEVTE